jgi:cytochrome c
MRKLMLVLAILAITCPVFAEGEDQKVMDLVTKAIEAFKTQGKDQAVKLLNASAGPFRKGSLYAFAVDFKGVNLSHPVMADRRGKDTWEDQDANGKFIVQDFIKIAKEKGEGWSEYWWIRVGEASPTLKRTYIKRVPGEEILVGSGYYVEKK